MLEIKTNKNAIRKLKKYREIYDDALQKMAKMGGKRVNKHNRKKMKRYTKKKKGVKQIVYTPLNN